MTLTPRQPNFEQEALYHKCRSLAWLVTTTVSHRNPLMSILRIPVGTYSYDNPYGLFWDYKKREWVSREVVLLHKDDEENGTYYFNYVSDSLTEDLILDQASAWLEEKRPSTRFCWVNHIGGFEVIPDGQAKPGQEQKFVVSMDGVIFA